MNVFVSGLSPNAPASTSASGDDNVITDTLPAAVGGAGQEVMETVARLIQAQTEAMAAQAKAAAITHLPHLAYFTGEGVTSHEDSFDHWVEKFKDRAQFVGWSSAEPLYQLKSHLDKTALEVFQALQAR